MLNRIVVFAALALAACKPAEAPPLDGARIGGPFTLQTAGGKTVTDKDFAGKYRIVYFGYTNCPDVCPTDMANLGRAVGQFRKDKASAPPLALIFVTVDPKRDTPDVSAKFAKAFLPDAVGLSGDQKAIDAAKKSFAVYGKIQEGGSAESYLVDHSRTSYLMDRDGKPMAILPSEQSSDAVLKDLERWGEVTRWWDELPLEKLDAAQWELLCDGCGKCCLHKLEDEDTGEYYPTNVACRQLDRRMGRCKDYANRKALVPDCIQLRLDNLSEFDWLPKTCGYRLRAEGKPLHAWHHLNSGSYETVHEAGESTRGWTISEVDAGELEYHMVDRDV